MSTLGVLTRKAYSKDVPEPLEQETFQCGRLFLRKLLPLELPADKGRALRHQIGIYTDAEGSNPKALSVGERMYGLPWETLVNVPPIQASLVSIEREYETERKLRQQ